MAYDTPRFDGQRGGLLDSGLDAAHCDDIRLLGSDCITARGNRADFFQVKSDGTGHVTVAAHRAPRRPSFTG